MSNIENSLDRRWKERAWIFIAFFLLAFFVSGLLTLGWALKRGDFAQYLAAYEMVVQNTWAQAVTATIAAVVAFVFGDKAKEAYVCRIEAKEREAHAKNAMEKGLISSKDDLEQLISQLKKKTA